jgi:hypothetical protein
MRLHGLLRLAKLMFVYVVEQQPLFMQARVRVAQPQCLPMLPWLHFNSLLCLRLV